MAQRTLNFSISLLLCLLVALPLAAQSRVNDAQPSPSQAQRPDREKEKKTPAVEYPLYNGVSLGVDLWGPGSKLLGSDFFSAEVSAVVNLKHRYFPTVELGYGSTDKWNDNGVHYKGSAPYLRIGLDYNTFYKKEHGHMLLVGLRYGVSPTTYDVTSLEVGDPVYGGSYDPNITDDIYGGNVAYNHPGMKCTMQWMELAVGVRAHVWKSLYMGWTVRLKYRLSAKPDTYGDPWYVPGYGKYSGNTMGVTYTIVYQLPF